MSIPTMTPRGWYADPSGRHEARYWDGTVWTARVSDHGLLMTDSETLPVVERAGPTAGPEDVVPTGVREPVAAASTGPAPETTVVAPTAPAPPAAAPAPAPDRRRRWWLLGALALAVALGLVGWMLWRSWVPGSPVNVGAKPPTATSVELTWSSSTGGPAVDQYLVLRNGIQVGSVASTVTTFTDQGLTPDSDYRYTVIAASGSKRSEASGELAVRTLPATPQGLQVADASATTVRISWDRPAAGPDPGSYVVLRDDVEIATIGGSRTSFEDSGLAPAATYRYRLVALTGTNRSEQSDMLTAQTIPAAPTALRAGSVTTGSITLQWSPPALGQAPATYVVLRNGVGIATVPGTSRSYVDKGLAPATAYSYSVVSVTAGQRSEPTAALTVRTFAPSVTAARFQGSWDVGGRITKSSNLTLGSALAAGQTISETWTVTPKCATGACDAVLKGSLAGHDFSMTLVRSGGVYTGSTKAHVSHCVSAVASRDVIDTLSVRLTLGRAGVTSGAWAASAWTGTLTMRSPYTSAGSSGALSYYCPSGSLTASLSGSR